MYTLLGLHTITCSDVMYATVPFWNQGIALVRLARYGQHFAHSTNKLGYFATICNDVVYATVPLLETRPCLSQASTLLAATHTLNKQTRIFCHYMY